MTPVALLSSLSLWWPVAFFGQVAGLGQTARVQRGPSQAARCASNGTALLPCPSSRHTGHLSSFHAISQNIHSYLELITNDSSILRFSSLLAVLAH